MAYMSENVATAAIDPQVAASAVTLLIS